MSRLFNFVSINQQQQQPDRLGREKNTKQRLKTNFALTAQLWFIKFGIDFNFEYKHKSLIDSTPLLKLIEQQKDHIDWNKRSALPHIVIKGQVDELVLRIRQEQQQPNGDRTEDNSSRSTGQQRCIRITVAEQCALKTCTRQSYGEHYHTKVIHLEAALKEGKSDEGYGSVPKDEDVKKKTDDSQKVEASSLEENENAPVKPSEAEEKPVDGSYKTALSTQAPANTAAADDLLSRTDTKPKASEAAQVRQPQVWNHSSVERVLQQEQNRGQQLQLQTPLQPYQSQAPVQSNQIKAHTPSVQIQAPAQTDQLQPPVQPQRSQAAVQLEQIQVAQHNQLQPPLQPAPVQSHQLQQPVQHYQTQFQPQQLQPPKPPTRLMEEQQRFEDPALPSDTNQTLDTPFYGIYNQLFRNNQPQRIENQHWNPYHQQWQQQQHYHWGQQQRANYWNNNEEMLYRQRAFFRRSQQPTNNIILPPIDRQRQVLPLQRKRPFEQVNFPEESSEQPQQVQHKVSKALEPLIRVNMNQVEHVLNQQLGQRKKKLLMCNPMSFLQSENEIVGQGVAGAVIAVRCRGANGRLKQNARQLVLKRTQLIDFYSKDDATLAVREIAAMTLNHPNLMSLEQVFFYDKSIYVVMNRMQETVTQLMRRQATKTLTEPIATHVLYEVTKGLAYLHASGFAHVDIKAENVLISHKGDVKLADFGHAALVGLPEVIYRGTPGFIAPEVAQRTMPWNEKADLWSLGIMMIELVSGGAPWISGLDFDIDMDKVDLWIVAHAERKKPPTLDRLNVSSTYKDAINQILQLDPETRATALQFEQYLRSTIAGKGLACATKDEFKQLLDQPVPVSTASSHSPATAAVSAMSFSMAAEAADIDENLARLNAVV